MTLNLTIETMQKVMFADKEHDRFTLEFYDLLETFKNKERRDTTITDKERNIKFNGIVEVTREAENYKVTGVKTFNEIK